MNRSIAVIGAPSSIGIRPYDDGNVRRLDLAPRALRDQGLVARLRAQDWGDVIPPPYEDRVRPPGRPRNESGVAAYSRKLGERVATAASAKAFVLVVGGDCSIVLGSLLGVRQSSRTSVGLIYVDAHADFATPEESRTGSAASMCLALAVGRGNTPLAHLEDEPLARPEDVVLIGRRDDAEPWYGQDALRASPMLDLSQPRLRECGPATVAQLALERVAQPELGGFWIHLDADALDPSAVPAVDSPEPGGLSLDETAELLTPLVSHPRALGLELTIYDPPLDPDRTSAARLAALLEKVLTSR
ncbi:MAG: arginase family protein [Acidobacteriales bacterium]|nr:arginase family protein [Terriglobales bacterium]